MSFGIQHKEPTHITHMDFHINTQRRIQREEAALGVDPNSSVLPGDGSAARRDDGLHHSPNKNCGASRHDTGSVCSLSSVRTAGTSSLATSSQSRSSASSMSVSSSKVSTLSQYENKIQRLQLKIQEERQRRAELSEKLSIKE